MAILYWSVTLGADLLWQLAAAKVMRYLDQDSRSAGLLETGTS